jgi:hypothetical protein
MRCLQAKQETGLMDEISARMVLVPIMLVDVHGATSINDSNVPYEAQLA